MATSSTSPLNPQSQPPQQPSQSQPLHNFSLPVLKWNTTSTTTHVHRSRRPSEPQPPHHHDHVHEPGSFASTRLTRTRFTSLSIHDKKELTPPPPSSHPSPALEDDHEPHKPWNLRPRRSVINNMNSISGGSVANSSGKLNAGLLNKETLVEEDVKSTRLRSGGEVRENEKRKSKKKEKNNKEQDNAPGPRFWISLSKDEIEEDIFVITGNKPSRRPKKRSKHEQKYLDTIFPGLWLVGTTADSYRIPDAPLKK